MIPPVEAWRRIEARLERLSGERCPRREALGRVLAAPVRATVDVPAQDVSAMDGYVLGAAPQEGKATPVRGVIAAGDAPGLSIEKGDGYRIMTGAPAPEGSERIVPIEDTDGGRDSVLVASAGVAGQHIRRRGEVTEVGDEILTTGTVISPATLGLLATHGHAEVTVFERPSVAFLTGGDEVVAPEETPEPGQLRDSHSDFFAGACSQLGLDAKALGIAPDSPEAIEQRVTRGLEHDVLLMSGGVSMGEFDLVEGALEKLGCEILFESVAIQPGKPVVAARHRGGWVFALPGNPASAMVTFWLFVRPALRRMMGFEDGYWHGGLQATLGGDAPGAKARDLFLAARVTFEDGRIVATPQRPAGSHDVGAYGVGSALLRIPARSEPQSVGGSCEVLPLAEWRDF
ncbi:MAG: molybdopterin molybdotransferase MoeA [Acidobacteriota bacterium]